MVNLSSSLGSAIKLLCLSFTGDLQKMIIRSKRWESSPCTSSLFSLSIVVTAVLLQEPEAASVVVPSSNCYALDNSSHLVDFSSWVGQVFEYEGKDKDLVVRFCKDVETRSNTGYVDFGWFDKFNHFVPGSGHVDFVQRFYNGDLLNCETSYDKLGRTAQVNIICGKCSNGQCRGELGCICNVSYESACRVSIELAIPCEKRGPRVFTGFTLGFSPRSWEIVHNGMTQQGYEKSNNYFSFRTEQTHIVLYMTAVASQSNLVQKPIIKVVPEEGLEVRSSGSAITGNPPTTLSPSMLILEWRCEKRSDVPYEVEITTPIDGYEPIQFTLSKMCEYRQDGEGDTVRGWAIFGILSCICITLSTFLCIGGLVYKTRVERQRGLDALPGITYLSACLETVSGGGSNGYSRPEDLNSAFASQASWEQPSPSNQRTWRPSERTYGSI
ncbi:uncharacterized protein LOC116200846 isoform X1 [Punica granatum]|uniref:Uncharacterized protein LOC116200846 isoform X1 n=1 Tax=Punica granatum TaxID=22663 RepID=A0A6P8CSL4_PUNGR|nr:uncharacterized protein LOC116200846 isoform X1 [Punica granatum]